MEYSGIQHYQKVEYFNNDLTKQQYRDELKIKLCKEKGINLIVVPYYVDSYVLKNGIYKYVLRNQKEKERLIKEYLTPLLEMATQQVD